MWLELIISEVISVKNAVGLQLTGVSGDLMSMSIWSEDSSLFTIEEIVRSQNENRAWRKELQSKVNVLIDTKLAKQISLATYANERNLLKQGFAECERRSRKLGNEALGRRRRGKRRLAATIPGNNGA